MSVTYLFLHKSMRKESEKYQHNKHSVGMSRVHLAFIPCRRRAVLKGDIAVRCREIFYEVALEKKWDLRALAVEPDHVHLFVGHQPDYSVSQVVKAFKGRSSRYLRREFPELLKMPSMWTHSYFYSTAGNVSSETIQKYINDPHHHN